MKALSRHYLFVICTFFCAIFSHVIQAKNALIPNYTDEHSKTCSCNCGADLSNLMSQSANNETFLKWSKHAALLMLTYGFENYSAASQKASRFFTQTGWENYCQALTNSHNLDSVIKNNLVVQAEILDELQIIKSGMHIGFKQWEIKIPVLGEYTGINRDLKQMLLLNLTILQDKPELGMSGIGIQNFLQAPLKPVKRSIFTEIKN